MKSWFSLFQTKRRNTDGQAIASRYRELMVAEIADVEQRSAAAGLIGDMRRMRQQILEAITGKVIGQITTERGLSRPQVIELLSKNPLPSNVLDPFANFRGPNHLLD